MGDGRRHGDVNALADHEGEGEAHVRSILAKLGFTTRTEVATWTLRGSRIAPAARARYGIAQKATITGARANRAERAANSAVDRRNLSG
jgi:hypothetical protein